MPYTSSEQAAFIKASDQSMHDKMHVSKIVEVVDINGDQLVSVAPIINTGPMMPDRTRDYKESEIITDIPVITGGCGGIAIKPNIEVGCIGTIVHFDEDITNYIVDNTLYDDPYTARRHDINDCFFQPGLTGINNSFNTDGCYEIISDSVVFRICETGFDVIVNGRSLIETLISTNSLPGDWGIL